MRAVQHPPVSVIICAYTERRWATLLTALAAIRTQTQPPAEVIVVIDRNPSLLARLRHYAPDVVALENGSAAGASGARNTGIRAARGDILAFLDDDAIPHGDWLDMLTAPYRDPLVAGVGGASLPHWEERRPAWFPSEFDWVVGCSHQGMPRRRAPVRNLWGCNMSLRREVFAEVGLFNPALGPVGTRPVNCEETELCIRIGRAWPDHMLLYEPRAIVRHFVPCERGRWRYFLARCYHEGRSKAYVSSRLGADHGLRSERAYTARTLSLGLMRNLGQVLGGRDVRGGAGRCAAIVAGLATATIAYCYGRLHPAAGLSPGACVDRLECETGGA